MWICTKCETFNEETSLVCCVCGNRRENTDAKCDTTVLESNFKSSMEDADQNSSKKKEYARIKKPDRETYKIKEGQDSADIPKELRPETPPAQEKPPVEEKLPSHEQKPQVQNEDISLMPEPQPFSDKYDNPFGHGKKPEEIPAAPIPVQPQNVPAAAGQSKTNLLPLLIIGGVAAAVLIAFIITMLLDM